MTLFTDFRPLYDDALRTELARHPSTPLPVLREDDLAGLPDPVRRYVQTSGAIGRPRPRSMRLEFDADMRRTPGGSPLRSHSVQVNFFDEPTRLFLMASRMYGLPVRALHLYRDAAATFRVRVASLVDMVDQSGPQISAAETVTVLNDLCVFAPGALVDERLTWRELDDRSSHVTFTHGPHTVTATLLFGDDDTLVDFVSDDRPDSSTGTFVACRWSTPLRDHAVIDGVRVPMAGEAVYHRPDGPFAYGEFRVRSLAYDVTAGSTAPAQLAG